LTAKKNLKPISYLVHPLLMNAPEILERIEKGNLVQEGAAINGIGLDGFDMVIGPNCYRIAPETAHLLDIADKAARRMKYPPREKKAKGSST